MYPEFVDFLGFINNDTGVQGKAFIFKMIGDKEQFECILFVHPDPNVRPFLTIDEDAEIGLDENDVVMQVILDKYPIKDLLAYEN